VAARRRPRYKSVVPWLRIVLCLAATATVCVAFVTGRAGLFCGALLLFASTQLDRLDRL
jgi:hypothetical protein